jgi:lambda family phage tail tape measure protein
MDIKQLGISVEAKGIKAATNQLSGLVRVAAQVDPVVKVAQKRLDELSGISLSGTKGQVGGVTEAFRSFKASVNAVADTSRTFKGLSASFTSIATASSQLGEAVPGLKMFNAQLIALHTNLSNMQGMAAALSSVRKAAQGGGNATGGVSSSATNAATQATNNLSKAQQALLNQIEKSSQMVGRTKAEYLELRAAMLGVSNQATPYIQKLREADQVNQKFGLSAKANAAALRMVPAQFTDIATQLAGGQNPLLILLQQGGQLRDMFHGFGNMFRAVGPIIGKFLLNPITLVVGAIATLGYGFIAGSAEAEKFGKTIAQTGNYIGLSINQFNALSKSVGDTSGLGQGKAAEALTALAATASIAGKNVDQLAIATTKFAHATGKDVKDIAEEFAKLSDKPSEGLVDLSKKYHYLTLATYAQVKALEEQGKKQEAVALATSAHADALNRMAKDVQENRGFLEKFWDGLTLSITKAKDALLNIGRDTKLQDLRDIVAGYEKFGAKATANNPAYDQVKNLLKIEEDRVASINKATAAKKEEQAAQEKATSSYRDLLTLQERANDNDSLAIRKKKALAELERDIANVRARAKPGSKEAESISEAAIARARNAIEEQFKERGGRGDNNRIASLKASLDIQKEELEVLKRFPDVYHEASEYKKQLYTVQNQIASGKLKKDELAASNQMVGILRQLVAGEEALNKAKDDYKSVQRWVDMKTWIDGVNQSLQDQLEYITQTGDASDARTEVEKKLAAATIASINERLSAEERLEASKRKSDLEATLLLERTVANTLSANKAAQEVSKTYAKYSEEISNLSKAYENQIKWEHLSNRERERQIALFEIEATRAKEVAELNVRITQARSEENSQLVLELEKLIALEDQLAAKRAESVNKKAATPKQLSDPGGLAKDAGEAWTDFYDSLEKQQDVFQSAYQDSMGIMSDSLNQFFTTGKMGWKELGMAALQMITQTITKLLILQAIEAATTLAGNGGVVGGSATAANGASFAGATSSFRFSKGSPFTNKVVNQPTPFRFASGSGFSKGLMGEAGPEAIMPLARTSSGDLGVQTTGGGSQTPVQVNVTVNSDGSSSTETSGGNGDADAKNLGAALGNKIRLVIIEEQRPGGLLTRS